MLGLTMRSLVSIFSMVMRYSIQLVGYLTELIISRNPKKVVVIEKDKNLTNILEKKFLNQINIITKDILTLPVEFYSKRNFLILGNLPYNISTKILSTWCLNNELSVSKMILMFQKEVAERILADVNSKNSIGQK